MYVGAQPTRRRVRVAKLKRHKTQDATTTAQPHNHTTEHTTHTNTHKKYTPTPQDDAEFKKAQYMPNEYRIATTPNSVRGVTVTMLNAMQPYSTSILIYD